MDHRKLRHIFIKYFFKLHKIFLSAKALYLTFDYFDSSSISTTLGSYQEAVKLCILFYVAFF